MNLSRASAAFMGADRAEWERNGAAMTAGTREHFAGRRASADAAAHTLAARSAGGGRRGRGARQTVLSDDQQRHGRCIARRVWFAKKAKTARGRSAEEPVVVAAIVKDRQLALRAASRLNHKVQAVFRAQNLSAIQNVELLRALALDLEQQELLDKVDGDLPIDGNQRLVQLA